MKGFSLIEVMVATTIAAILFMLAMPSFVHHNNLMTLRSEVATFKWGYIQMPPLPLDPSWHQNGTSTTYTKSYTQPTGVLTIVAPATVGGTWSCSFSDSSYLLTRC